jgi:hypothetical protein
MVESRFRLSPDSRPAAAPVKWGRLQFDHAFPENPFLRSPALRAGFFFFAFKPNSLILCICLSMDRLGLTVPRYPP